MHDNETATLPTLAFAGGTRAMTLTPIIGTPKRRYAEAFVPGEEPIEGAWRELAEETGLGPDDVVARAEFPDWVVYEWPSEIHQVHGKSGRRRGQVHNVRAEPLHHRPQPAAALQADPEVGVERQHGAAGVGDGEAGVRRGSGRRDQLGDVPLGGEVLQHPAHGVGDPVDLGQEGLGDHKHPQRRGVGSGERDGETDEVCRAAATPPLEQVHGRDARERGATADPSREDGT